MNNQQQMAVSAMSELPQTKAQLQVYNELVKEAALSGNDDIIEVAKKVNMMGRIVEAFTKDADIQDALLNEAMKYGKGERSDIQVRETGVKYFYSEAGCEEYDLLLAQKEQISERMKQLENYMKNGVVNQLTGEIQVPKAAKQSTTKVVLTIK